MISYLKKPVLTVILGVVCLLDPCSGAADPFESNGTPQYVAGERVMFYHPKYKAWGRGNVIESTIISQSDCDHYLYSVQDDHTCEIHEILGGGLRALGVPEPEPQRKPKFRPAEKKAGKRRARGRQRRKPNTLPHPKSAAASESGWSTAATVGDVQSAKDSNYEYNMTPEQSRAYVTEPLCGYWFTGDGTDIKPEYKRRLVRGGETCNRLRKQGQGQKLERAIQGLDMRGTAKRACKDLPGYGLDPSLKLTNLTLRQQHPDMFKQHESRSRSNSPGPKVN